MKRTAFAGLVLLCPLMAWGQSTPQTPAPSTAATTPQTAPSTFEETESVWSVGVFYWRPNGNTDLIPGKQSTDPAAQTLPKLGKPQSTPGLIITAPTSRGNRLELSIWETRATGNHTASQDLNFFGTDFPEDTFLITEYKVRNVKVTWNFLTYPYPPLASKFRIKTLWEVQYTRVSPVITAPYTATSDTAATRGSGSRTVVYPTFGLGMEWIPSLKHFRVEARGSGMALPHKSQIWDVEANAVLRYGGFELFGGAKGFHFKTKPNDQHRLDGTIWGPLVGVRWVFH